MLVSTRLYKGLNGFVRPLRLYKALNWDPPFGKQRKSKGKTKANQNTGKTQAKQRQSKGKSKAMRRQGEGIAKPRRRQRESKAKAAQMFRTVTCRAVCISVCLAMIASGTAHQKGPGKLASMGGIPKTILEHLGAIFALIGVIWSPSRTI